MLNALAPVSNARQVRCSTYLTADLIQPTDPLWVLTARCGLRYSSVGQGELVQSFVQ